MSSNIFLIQINLKLSEHMNALFFQKMLETNIFLGFFVISIYEHWKAFSYHTHAYLYPHMRAIWELQRHVTIPDVFEIRGEKGSEVKIEKYKRKEKKIEMDY